MKIEVSAKVAGNTRDQFSLSTSHVRHVPYCKYLETVYIEALNRKRATLHIGVC